MTDDAIPGTGPKKRRVQSVLFMCNFNAVRSLAAEAIARHYFGKSTYVQSAGVRSGEPSDPFMVAALDEIGIDASRHKPRTIEQLEDRGWTILLSTLPGRAGDRADGKVRLAPNEGVILKPASR